MGLLVLALIGALTAWLTTIVRQTEDLPAFWVKIGVASGAAILAGMAASFMRRGPAVLDGRIGLWALLIGFFAAIIATFIVARIRETQTTIAARHRTAR